MGVEYSRRNSLHGYEDGFIPELMNNQQPLRFHAVHGENVHLCKNGAIASRDEGFCKGIVFSQRPVAINEHIYVKFLDISTCWSGGLRIGFTANDPVSYKHKLPKYACPCMTDMPGNWARALAERFVQKDSVLFYYVNREGDVHYGLDNEEHGIFFSGVGTSGKLWAMMDIYGNTIRIELLMSSQFLNSSKRRQHEVLNSCNSTGRNVASLLDEVNLFPLHFHSMHGKHVAFSRNRTIAVQSSCFSDHGYAFTENPIVVNNYVVMRILGCDAGCVTNLVVGLTSCDPSSLRSGDLPSTCPDDLLDRPEYWVISTIKENFKTDDILLFIITNDGALKYSKNGSQLSTVMFVDHKLDLWFFITLNRTVTEVQLEGSCRGMQEYDILDYVRSFVGFPVQQPRSLSFVSASQRSMEDCCECVICCEANSDSALYRCGHVCMCYNCASHLKRSSNALCPICREVIKDVIKLYK